MIAPRMKAFLANAGSGMPAVLSLQVEPSAVETSTDELELAADLRQDHLPRERDGRDRDDLGTQVDPAGVPGPGRARQLLRPLVDRAGERIVRRELGELQRDGHLAEEDDRPGPDEGAAGEEEAQGGGLEHAGQDRDVREARREAREAPERAVQLLLVPERREIVRVGVVRFAHGPPVVSQPGGRKECACDSLTRERCGRKRSRQAEGASCSASTRRAMRNASMPGGDAGVDRDLRQRLAQLVDRDPVAQRAAAVGLELRGAVERRQQAEVLEAALLVAQRRPRPDLAPAVLRDHALEVAVELARGGELTARRTRRRPRAAAPRARARSDRQTRSRSPWGS